MERINMNAELKSHFLRLYQIALSDESFTHLEMALLYEFAQERGVSKDELDTILTSYTGKIIVPESLEKKIEYLYDFAQMIWADQIVNEEERIALEKYIRTFGFKEENVSELASYMLQGVQEGKSKQTILIELNE